MEISLAEIGGKGLFTRELDVALASKEAVRGDRGERLVDTKRRGWEEWLKGTLQWLFLVPLKGGR